MILPGVLWTRQLGLVLGGSALASGLFLGAIIAGYIADRTRVPLTACPAHLQIWMLPSAARHSLPRHPRPANWPPPLPRS